MISNFYFRNFILINLIGLGILWVVRIFVPQTHFIVLIHVCILLGFAILAKLNFELLRPWAGVGATLIVLFFARLTISYLLVYKIGVPNLMNEQQLEIHKSFFQSPQLIELFATFGLIGTFMTIYDIYSNLRKMSVPKSLDQ